MGTKGAALNRTGKSQWWKTLNTAQLAAIKEIRQEEGFIRGGDGWSVRMSPTTGPAKKLELTYRTIGVQGQPSKVNRWAIYPDGLHEPIEVSQWSV